MDDYYSGYHHLLANDTFPSQLMNSLSDPTLSDLITWLPDGKSWKIIDKKRFETEVLPRYFGPSKWTSFTRRLKRWNFTRISHGPHIGSYYHPLFQRDKPLLCNRMTSMGDSTGAQQSLEGKPTPVAFDQQKVGALQPSVPKAAIESVQHQKNELKDATKDRFGAKNSQIPDASIQGLQPAGLGALDVGGTIPTTSKPYREEPETLRPSSDPPYNVSVQQKYDIVDLGSTTASKLERASYQQIDELQQHQSLLLAAGKDKSTSILPSILRGPFQRDERNKLHTYRQQEYTEIASTPQVQRERSQKRGHEEQAVSPSMFDTDTELDSSKRNSPDQEQHNTTRGSSSNKSISNNIPRRLSLQQARLILQVGSSLSSEEQQTVSPSMFDTDDATLDSSNKNSPNQERHIARGKLGNAGSSSSSSNKVINKDCRREASEGFEILDESNFPAAQQQDFEEQEISSIETSLKEQT